MRKPWTAAEDARLRAKFPHTQTAKLAPLFPGRTVTALSQHALNLGLHKSSEYLASPAAQRLDGKRGTPHRFPKGHTPWNLGKSGYMGANRTSFGKGHTPANRQEVGALRINADGVLDIKAYDGLNGWESLARFVWRTERGPIPAGNVVRPINGDNHDTRIENLRLGTKASVMQENTYHNYPKPLARLIQLRGALQRQINKRTEHD